jgi:hypothetical protein
MVAFKRQHHPAPFQNEQLKIQRNRSGNGGWNKTRRLRRSTRIASKRARGRDMGRPLAALSAEPDFDADRRVITGGVFCHDRRETQLPPLCPDP